ncbi:MAG TPA: response regulator [Puia sp.]|nr:response regulator [Puia sp.]
MTNKITPYLLLADDDPDDQELLAHSFLERNPTAEIRYFSDGRDVLTFLNHCPTNELPVVMLLDYKMPIVTGGEVLAAIKDNPRLKEIPKFVWSTSNNTQYSEECLKRGALEYFVKPSDVAHMEEIVACLTRIFRLRSSA